MKHIHCNPSEAVQIHEDLRSRQSVGIHWGTFPLADEADIEPALDLALQRDARGMAANEFFTMGLGENYRVNGDVKGDPSYDVAIRRPDLFEYFRANYVPDES